MVSLKTFGHFAVTAESIFCTTYWILIISDISSFLQVNVAQFSKRYCDIFVRVCVFVILCYFVSEYCTYSINDHRYIFMKVFVF